MDRDPLDSYREALRRALDDGVVDRDESALLHSIRARFPMDDGYHQRLIEHIREIVSASGGQVRVHRVVTARKEHLLLKVRRVRAAEGQEAVEAQPVAGAVPTPKGSAGEPGERSGAARGPAEPGAEAGAERPRVTGMKRPRVKRPRHRPPPSSRVAEEGTAGVIDGSAVREILARGNSLLLAGNVQGALEVYDRALAGPGANVAELWFARGAALESQGRAIDAISSYERAVALDPGHVLALEHRGMLLGRMGRLPEARESFMAETRAAPDRSEGWRNLGIVQEIMGDHEGAIQTLRKAHELDPRDTETLFNMGNAYANLNDYLRAVECYKRVLDLEPDHEDARINRDWCIARMRATSHQRPEIDYYELLGVDTGAGELEIKSAYIRMIKEYHPDRYRNATSEEKEMAMKTTMLLNEALSVLSDPEKRREYDRRRQAWAVSG